MNEPTPVPTPEELERFAREASYALINRTRIFTVMLITQSWVIAAACFLVMMLLGGYTVLVSLALAVFITVVYLVGAIGGYRYGSAAVTVRPPA